MHQEHSLAGIFKNPIKYLNAENKLVVTRGVGEVGK